MLAAARGARVIAVNPAPTRLRRSLSFGAAETVDPATTDPVAAIRELTGGRGAQLVLETSGLPMTSGMRRSSSGALRFDLAPYGISTMAVEPGFFRTELLVEGSSTIWPELEIDDYAERTAQTCGCQQL